MDSFAKLPTPVKFGLALLIVGAIIGALGAALRLPPSFYVIMAMGIVLVALLLLGFHWFIGWKNKRKAVPFSRGIADNTASAPQGISEPARRARLDDLRRNFEQGIEKFRAAGKNLYSVPWYVLVGEPGSGKTEAIRHCNVGFPPGLQDQLQGAGGTLNMNWWFTNHAIIVDTAGRLMFEEVVPGTTSEWQEFLKLLKSNRPNCPINGMLLVIPSESLVKDSAESLEKKAAKIAQQLDNIQRTLGVRFPVFIIITKCDLLNGFREFFDDLNDPKLQHQIMGWSNPAPLDERFNPEAVNHHLATVRSRLVERRTRLLLDPVNSDDPNARRIDQVDALYALPETLMKIAPRLRRYLETIFVSGEWSPKPLFLRGIYFTSSMTEGSALDADLAEALGIPVDSLPEGRAWQRDRAFFLRDLFMQKVFREKGLVTYAGNATRLQRRRKFLILGAGAVAALIMSGLTWLGASALNRSIGQESDFWTAVQSLDPKGHMIVTPQQDHWAYNNATFALQDDRGHDIEKGVAIAHLLSGKQDLVARDISIPTVFRWVALLEGNINSDRRSAFRTFYDQTVLLPLVKATRDRLSVTNSPATAEATSAQTSAFIQLLRTELAGLHQSLPDVGAPAAPIDLIPMFHYVLPESDTLSLKPEDRIAREQDYADLQKTFAFLYGKKSDGSWPPKLFAVDTADSAAAIDVGLTNVLATIERQAGEKNPRLSALLALRDALKDFQFTEDSLFARESQLPSTVPAYQAFADVFRAQLAKLVEARTRAQAAIQSYGPLDDASLRDLYNQEVIRSASVAQQNYDLLLSQLPEHPDKYVQASPDAATLADARQKVQQAMDRLTAWKANAASPALLAEMADIDKSELARLKAAEGTPVRRYDLALLLYRSVESQLPNTIAAHPSSAAVDVAAALAKMDKNASDTRGLIDRTAILGPSRDDRLILTANSARFILDAGDRAQRFLIVTDALAATPATQDAVFQFVEAHSDPKNPAMNRIPVRLTTADPRFLARFDPEPASRLLSNFRQVTDLLSASAADPASAAILERASLRTQFNRLQPLLENYSVNYSRYWTTDVFDEMKFTAPSFSDFAQEMAKPRLLASINTDLDTLGERAAAALTSAGDATGAAKIRAAMSSAEAKPTQKSYADMLDNWTGLGASAPKARQLILAMRPRRFIEDFILDQPKTDDEFIANYWRTLSVQALHILAVDAEQQVVGDLDRLLATYKRFPLAAPADKQAALTAQEVGDARGTLIRILGSIVTPGAEGPATIGEGLSANDKPVDDELERLRGARQIMDRQREFTPIRGVLEALPETGKTFACTITVDKSKLRADDSPSLVFAKLVLNLDGKTLSTVNLRARANAPDAVEKGAYPSGPLALALYSDPQSNTPDQTITVDGIWSCLKILHDTSATRDEKDPHKWSVMLSFKDSKGAKRTLPLVLEFEQVVPELANWPQPEK